MSAGGWFDNSDVQYRFNRLAAEADADRAASQTGYQPLLSRWRCWIGLHHWREVEMPDHDKCAECTRGAKRDGGRLLRRGSGEFRGAAPPGGAGDVNF